MKEILASGHLLELFMPYFNDGPRMQAVVEKAAEVDDGFYKSLEVPVYPDSGIRKGIRNIADSHGIMLTTYSTPYLDGQALSLCSLDRTCRKKAIELEYVVADMAADMGMKYMGIPSGPDPGAEKREEAKKVLADSFDHVASYAARLGIGILLEPLDRYAHKKKLLGPMAETVEWFGPVHEKNPNTYIHWDAAHEQLGGIDLFHSLDLCAPYLQRIHLCSCITDPEHPCFGDLHMDIGQPPEFHNDGFLTLDLGKQLLQHAAQSTVGDTKTIYASVEVNSKPGDDMWHKEFTTRTYLKECLKGLQQ